MNADHDRTPNDTSSSPTTRDLRSFGRRRGRALSDRQKSLLETVLPRTRLNLQKPPPPHLPDLFDASVNSVWLEIGFGAAEHLIWQAHQNPRTGIIGCEPYVDGVVKALSAIDEDGLANIRLYDDDVRDVLRWLKAASLDRVFILFPDPWPKARHRKRRLVNPKLLALLARAMRPGAHLIIATDIADYARSIMIAAQRAKDVFNWQAAGPRDWRSRPGKWPRTRYEEKAAREGRAPYFFTFERSTAGTR